jgi:NTE family protein
MRLPTRSATSHRVGTIAHLLAFLLLLLSFTTAAAAAETPQWIRPRIGLVLSGGGARGTAHIGVLKVLEELRIPVDVIAGTSMGAIVGGVYAAGSSPAELEAMVTSIEWNQAFLDRPPLEDLSFRRKEDSANQMIKFDAGIRDGKLALPLGLIQGQNLNFILKSRLIHTYSIHDFDQLRIPFRAVAADIETGEAVVLGKGDLSNAMRASMSIPGVFAPVEIDGRLLVDGGIADNLPVDVAKKLGADILIAVNIGTLRRSRENLTSAMMITTQVMTILIQKNTDEQIAALREGDILLQPSLGSIGSSDFAKASEAIRIGEAEARRMAPRLAGLALPPAEYANWLSAQRRQPFVPPIITTLTVENASPISDEVVRAQIRTKPGEPLNLETLEGDLKRIYSISIFEKAGFRLAEREGKTGLVIETKEKTWGPSYLRFGLSLNDDFQGSAGYNLSANLTATGINRLGAEWENHVQIGDTPRFFSEFYQPLDDGLRYFIAPRVEYKSWNINAHQDGAKLLQYRATAMEGGIDIGRQFGNWGQLRLGLRRGSGNVGVRIGLPAPDIQFNSGAVFSSFSYNRLDNFNFPRHGTAADVIWMIPRSELGSDYSGNGLLVNWLTAMTRQRHTLLTGVTIQSALNSEAPLQNSYPLGGFLNLSGFAPDELSGQHTGLARLIYYYELGSTGLGEFRMPLYIGGSFEGGNAWAARSEISGRSVLFAGSLLIGADTYLGPLYLAYGQAEGGHHSIYLYLGHKF